MKNILLVFVLFASLATKAQNKVQTKKQNPLYISFTSSNSRFAKDLKPAVSPTNNWETTAWKGEKIHTQILVWADRDIAKLTLSISDLKTKAGNQITKANAKIGFVQYVITDEFGGGCGHRKPEDFKSSLVADPINWGSSIEVKKNNLQPIWLSINIPANTTAGQYKGIVTINSGRKISLPIVVNVLEHLLPSADKWKFDLDLWQHPAAIARVHKVELWSKEHFEKMRPYYTMLANAGQKSITTSIMNEPWGHQTYDDFPSLIKWVKKKDGSWFYDYSLFDKYVSFVMSCGITKRINCYSMVPWKLSFQYYDESLSKDTELVAKIGSDEYNSFWSSMIKDFTKHLKEKGWFSISTIAMDERPMKDMQTVIKLLKDIDPNWKIALAGNYHPEIEKDIFDYSIASRFEFDAAILKERTALGKPSTWYTCCEENYPNGFTFSPPAEHVWMGWYAAAKGFTGYLRWAYNSWPQNPLTDSRFTAWPAGDTFQVYPGPMTSIRFEKLIEGIQDFEKIHILQQGFKQSGNQAKIDELNQLLSTFDLKMLKEIPSEKIVDEAKSKLKKF
ncbi:DUF4091 domain-containing protein [Flavobacterium granuli]|uniref:Uncharacterized protein DUF4091 n=1 Tax=Flavobacterium granuli TaxID=280093 RepID=A0A1M5QTH8_9FLAO|nr:DUF4091 domain-containing protein [Flavobacterium granuli]PRZ25271.1 uncharacterized protein DUF4091 [Flavobacterium granuli]SHH16913.1 protein of unknown function [Flavobacterium granuli]